MSKSGYANPGLSLWLRRSSLVATSLAVGVVIGVSGCGGAPPSKGSQASSSDSNAGKTESHSERVSADERPTRGGSKKDSGIPYDAFLDDPLQIAQNNAVIAKPAAPADGGPKDVPMDKPAEPQPNAGAAAGAPSWADYISGETLQDEIKKVRNHLASSFTNPGTYNGTYKDIAVDGAVMAALAGIVTEGGADVSWKANAPFVRNFGSELSKAAVGLGKENFEKSKNAYEKLTSTLSGALPGDAGKAEPKLPFNETADRAELMKRIEKAKNWMRDNINNDAKLKGETETITHEASIISALGKVVSTEGYGSTDEKDYQNFVNALITGAQEASAAAKDQNLKKFTDAMNKVSKSCDQCHANYGNGG